MRWVLMPEIPRSCKQLTKPVAKSQMNLVRCSIVRYMSIRPDYQGSKSASVVLELTTGLVLQVAAVPSSSLWPRTMASEPIL